MGFYIESADRPYKSRIVNEDIRTGELGADNGSDQAVRFDASSHGEDDLLGVATQPRRGDYIAAEDDETTDFHYKSADNDRASFGGDADRDVIKVRSAEDTGGNEAAPDFSGSNTVVGVIDTSAGTLTSTGEYKGRIVQEGYTDGEATPTTYNRSNNNFFALGIAHRDDTNAFDEPVRVEVRKDLN